MTEIEINEALRLGIDAHKLGKFQEADAYYSAILRTQPHHSHANHNMGVLALSRKNLDKSLFYFRVALESDRSVEQFWVSYIDALIKAGEKNLAEKMLNEARNTGIIGVEYHQLKKRIDILTGKSPVKIADRGPSETELSNLICIYNAKKFDAVLKEAEKLISEFPDNPILYNLFGAASRAKGDLDNAISAYNRAISLDPDYSQAHNNKGNALKDKGMVAEAIDCYKKALAISPKYSDAYVNLGTALQECGELDQALNSYESAIQLTGDNAEALNNMGNIFQQQNIGLGCITRGAHGLHVSGCHIISSATVWLQLGSLKCDQKPYFRRGIRINIDDSVHVQFTRVLAAIKAGTDRCYRGMPQSVPERQLLG